MMVVVSPLQTEVLKAVAVPPTEVPSALTDTILLLAEEHFPLVTNALYHVFAVRFGVVKVAVVAPLPPLTLLQPVVPLADCCHCIFPVFPDKPMVVLPPVQIAIAVAVAVPPTEVGSTVAVSAVREADKQPVVAFRASV